MKVPMTPNGYTKLETELKDLRENQRPAATEAVASAREHGDLKENGEYHAARERQAFIEGRIGEIEGLLANAEVIDPAKFSGVVVKFGATVMLENEETGKKINYQLVGSEESDLKIGKIAYDSPVGRSLIGKSEGDFIEVSTPAGIDSYRLLKVSYLPPSAL